MLGGRLRRFTSQPEIASGIVETAPGSNKFKPADDEVGRRSMYVLSSMLLDAMSHATHALDYLALLKEQSVFNFCAIPQVMAIATIELMFNNPDVFKKNVKIRKGVAVGLILKAVNPRDVAYTFLSYSRKIHKRLSLRSQLHPLVRRASRIEQWCETYYPSFIAAQAEGKAPDARAAALRTWSENRRTQALIMKHANLQGRDPSSADAKQALEMAKQQALDPRD